METVSTLQSGNGLGHAANVDRSGATYQRSAEAAVRKDVVTVGTSGGVLVDALEGRRALFIANRGGATAYVRFEDAAADDTDWPIEPGGTFRAESFPYAGVIRAIAPAEATPLLVLQLWSAH